MREMNRNGGVCLAIAEPRGHREPERNTTGCEQDVRVHGILRRMTLAGIDATADQLRWRARGPVMERRDIVARGRRSSEFDSHQCSSTLLNMLKRP